MIRKQMVLMYHSIGGSGTSEIGAELYCVAVDKFREQMEHLSSLAHKLISSYVITFDDGLLNNYTQAYPVLKKLNLKAYFFILVPKVGTAGYMNWEQIKELRDAGMTIGSHGMTHRILTELNDEELDYEFGESKKILEQKLGVRVEYLSIPRGFTNKNVIEKAKEVGYKAIFTSNPKDNDGFKIGRIPVRGNWSLEYFIQVLNNGLSLRDRTEELIKNSSKRILGAGYYDKIRTKILKK